MSADSYLVWRKGMDPMAGAEPAVWEGSIFFQLWSKKIPPYGTLEDGDTMYLLDRKTNRLVWEWRARHILRRSYDSRDEVFAIIQGAYGLEPEDLNLVDYVLQAPLSGFLLAWSLEVVAPLDIAFSNDFKLGNYGFRAGYAALSKLPASLVDQLELPPNGRPAVVYSPLFNTADAEQGQVRLPRYIPSHVRQRVLQRDKHRCVICQRGIPDVAVHIDHIRPYSRGGSSSVDNLQVLCASHNLSKGNKIDGNAPPPVWNPEDHRLLERRLTELRTAVVRDPTAADVLELLASDTSISQTEAVQLLQPHANTSNLAHRAAVQWELAKRLPDDETADDDYWNLIEAVYESAEQPWASRAALLLVDASDREQAESLAREVLEVSDERDARAEAAAILLEHGDENDISLLRMVLQSTNVDQRAAAAYFLIRLHQPDIADLARVLLSATDPELRQEGLARLDDLRRRASP